MRKVLFAFFILVIGLSCNGYESSQKLPKNLTEAEFVRVVDGDTIVINLNGLEEKVRLIGIDTPESRFNRRSQLQEKELGKSAEAVVDLGRQAKEFTKSMLSGVSKVYLEFDVQQRDKYGRLLAYVYLPDGRMLNREIICGGYAMPLTIPPNVKYEGEFRECFNRAREEKKGLWNE